MKISNLILSTVTILALSGCGNETKTTQKDTPSTTSNTATIFKGVVVDGYISGATVCLDINTDNKCNSGEENTLTDNNGRYSLSYTFTSQDKKLNSQLLVYGGIDTDTGKLFEGQLVTNIDNSTNEINISPLTTALAHLRKSGKTTSDAKKLVANMFKIQESEIGKDPVEAANNGKVETLIAALELQKAVEMIVETKNITDVKEKRETSQEIYKNLSELIDTDTTDVASLLDKAYDKGSLTYNEKESAKVVAKTIKDEINRATDNGTKNLSSEELSKITKIVAYVKVELNTEIKNNITTELSSQEMQTIATVKVAQEATRLEKDEADKLAIEAKEAAQKLADLNEEINKADAEEKARLQEEARVAQALKDKLQKEAKQAEEEAQRLAKAEADAKIEATRVEAQQREKARLEKIQRDKIEAQRLAKIEADRIEAERLAKIEADKLAQEQREITMISNTKYTMNKGDKIIRKSEPTYLVIETKISTAITTVKLESGSASIIRATNK